MLFNFIFIHAKVREDMCTGQVPKKYYCDDKLCFISEVSQINAYNLKKTVLVENRFNELNVLYMEFIYNVGECEICLWCRFVISVGRRTHHIIGDNNLNSISFVS